MQHPEFAERWLTPFRDDPVLTPGPALRALLAGGTRLGGGVPAPPRAPERPAPPPEPPAADRAVGQRPAPERPAPSPGGIVVPELYCPDAVREDPGLVRAVDDGIVAWAEEIGIYEGRRERLRSSGFGRLMVLAHPDCSDPDRLLAAAKCAVAEWSVDDHWVDEGEDTDPALITLRTSLAHAAVDPVRMPPRYQARFEETVTREPVLRAFRSALDHLGSFATPTQVARLRHELACMFVGYGQEAQWRMSGRRPPVWEYLMHRYQNAFFPCMVLTDPVGGYELPAHEFADPRVRRTYLYAGMAAVLLNDLYSMGQEDPGDSNLPVLIALEDGVDLQEAVNRAAAIHDEIMRAIERESAALTALGSPMLGRFLNGVWNWMGGSKRWHATSRRYHDVAER
ncbi:family 2 encapsulin nanocompartment cargo protein terpene cyclase [Streptomyces sp. BI20]|uniref:family 2 encapsulin nanocompartment cargo protein terpene cyclase n=1 Tax=Streptomyces sp. BI20 TaxID=3403460 RepID=UPI003C76627A